MDSHGIWGLQRAQQQSDYFHDNLSGLLDSIPPRVAPAYHVMLSGTQSDQKRSSSLTDQVMKRLEKKPRDRRSDVHKLAEKKRRGKINDKMKSLRELIPNSRKLDIASFLDKAISHIKALQWQIHIMQGMNLFPNPLSSPFALQAQISQFPPPGGLNIGVSTGQNFDFPMPTSSSIVRDFVSVPVLPQNPYF